MASLIVACFFFSMGNKPSAWVLIHWFLRLTSHLYDRAKGKYKLTAIIFAVLTTYMLVCSVICAIVAMGQAGGGAMLLSILITYGGGCAYLQFMASYWAILDSVCIQQRTGSWPMAFSYQLHAVSATLSNIYQHLEYVSQIHLLLLNLSLTMAYSLATRSPILTMWIHFPNFSVRALTVLSRSHGEQNRTT